MLRIQLGEVFCLAFENAVGEILKLRAHAFVQGFRFFSLQFQTFFPLLLLLRQSQIERFFLLRQALGCDGSLTCNPFFYRTIQQLFPFAGGLQLCGQRGTFSSGYQIPYADTYYKTDN